MGAVILNEAGEVLLVKHRPERKGFWQGKWICPGGALEVGEKITDGIIREVKEESGLDILNVKLFFQKSNIDVAKNKQFVTLVFHAKTSSADVVLSPEDHDNYAWINPSEINNYKTVNYLVDCLSFPYILCLYI